ncbi:hypothetical protein ALC56_10620, partial [Trachymyrmex septentrionalis]
RDREKKDGRKGEQASEEEEWTNLRGSEYIAMKEKKLHIEKTALLREQDEGRVESTNGANECWDIHEEHLHISRNRDFDLRFECMAMPCERLVYQDIFDCNSRTVIYYRYIYMCV